MAKKPTKKPAAKRGGKKKGAPSAKTPRRQVERHGKARAAEREFGRKPDTRAQNSALPHYDPTDVAFSQPGKPGQVEHYDPSIVPKHPTVEEQFRAEHPDDAVVPARRGFWQRFRSAITGRWVSLGFAKRHPRTTVGERVD